MLYNVNGGGGKIVLKKDVERMLRQVKIGLLLFVGILYLLHNDSYFRTLFYYRIGLVMSLLIGWYRPGTGISVYQEEQRLEAVFY